MARANTRTLLSLDRFFEVIGMNPIHANQVHILGLRTCDEPIYQYAWQDAGRISREDIARAIGRAENSVGRELGYDIAPKWNSDELVHITDWQWSGKTNKGYVIGGGVETLSLVSADVPILFDSRFTLPLGAESVTETSSLNYRDKATIEVATSVTDPNEISVFYPESALNKLGVLGGSYSWEIRPITVSIASGIATITINRHQLVTPELVEQWVPGSIDGLTDDNFLGLVDVYRHYNDPSTQVEFRYRTCCCGYAACGQAICTYSTFTGCLLPYRSRLGYVGLNPGTYDGSSFVYDMGDIICERPEGALLNYKAGLDLVGGRIDSELELAVANLALSYLPTSICSCSGINARYDYMAEDFVRVTSGYGQQPNPLGTTRAAYEAWEVVKSRALGRSGGHA